MVKHVLFSLLLLTTQKNFGQNLVFQVERLGFCSKTKSIDSSGYYLTRADVRRSDVYECKKGRAILPGPGKYILRFDLAPEVDVPVITIPAVKRFVYTFREPKIIWSRYGTDHYGFYEICGQLAQGYQEEYYDNGKLKLRANFDKGVIKDSFVTFYPTGGIEKRVVHLPDKVYVEVYDSLSRLKSVLHNAYNFMEYNDHSQTDYFPDGKIQKKTEWVNHFYLYKEYYSNGQLKTNQAKDGRFDFYENGSKKYVYTWDSQKKEEIKGEVRYDVTTTRNYFDSTGALVEKIVYESWNQFQSQPEFQVFQSDWIIKWSKFRGGKEMVLAKDIDSKEYLKKRKQPL